MWAQIGRFVAQRAWMILSYGHHASTYASAALVSYPCWRPQGTALHTLTSCAHYPASFLGPETA